MVESKEIIRQRLKTESAWVTTTYTNLSTITYTGLAAGMVPERMIRYVVGLLFNGNVQKTVGIEVSTLNEGGTPGTADDHEIKFSHVNVAPADNPQLPEGAYDIEDAIFNMEGGVRGPYARCLQVGHSVNCTVTYWDNDI